MENTIEIKAIDKEKAIERALKILDINLKTDKKELRVIEKIKPKKKLFGLLGIENGIYEVTVLNQIEEVEVNVEKNKKVTKELEKKNEINKVKEIKKEEKVNSLKEKSEDIIKEKKNESDEKNAEEEIFKTAKELLTKMNLDLKVEVKKIKDKVYLVDLSGKDNAIIIGQKGKTLNSFEYILNSLLNSYRIEVDVEKFKEKRYETLRVLGKRMAEKVIKTGKTVRLNAMPARERKIIHEVVGKYQGLDTFSEGREPKRYIVIKKKR